MIITALGKLYLSQDFVYNPKIEAVLRDFTNSKHIDVQ